MYLHSRPLWYLSDRTPPSDMYTLRITIILSNVAESFNPILSAEMNVRVSCNFLHNNLVYQCTLFLLPNYLVFGFSAYLLPRPISTYCMPGVGREKRLLHPHLTDPRR